MKLMFKIITIFIILILMFFYLLRIINHSYEANEFGLEYNEERVKNNIPELKKDWSINDKNALLEYYDDNSFQNGHKKKYINLSKSIVGSERDVFKVDSIIFFSLYERNDDNRVIYQLIANKSNDIFKNKKKVISSEIANELLKKTDVEFRFNNSWNMHLDTNK